MIVSHLVWAPLPERRWFSLSGRITSPCLWPCSHGSPVSGGSADWVRPSTFNTQYIKISNVARPIVHCPALQLESQKAVTAYFSSKQLLPFGFARHCYKDTRIQKLY